MLWYTITAHPVVEPRTYTELVAGTASFKDIVTQGNEADSYSVTREGATSNSVEQSQITSSNGDSLGTVVATMVASESQILIDDTVGTNTSQTEESSTEYFTQVNSWNGRVLNSNITEVKSQTTNYSWNTGYTFEEYTYAAAVSGGTETFETTAITGQTTKTTTGKDSRETVVATTVGTTQSVNRTLNLGEVQKTGTRVTTTALPPITMWQTNTVEATRVEYTANYQASTKTFSLTRYAVGPTSSSETYTPITDTTGVTGVRGTRTVVLLASNETLLIPTITGIGEQSALCASFAGPTIQTISPIFSTRQGGVFNEESISAVTTYTNEVTRTLTTTSGTTTQSTEIDGIYPGGNPTIWTNLWPMKDAFSVYPPIPAARSATLTKTKTTTTTATQEATSISVGNAKTDSQIAWKTTYYNTTTPDGAWQNTCFTFTTEINQKRVEGTQNTKTETEYTTTAENGETTEAMTGSFENGRTWVEHVSLWTEALSSNPLYATITHEREGQAPLSNLTQRAKKVSIANTTVTAWQPAAAMWNVDFVAAVFPQTFSMKNTAASQTTSGKLWAGGYSETIFDNSSLTSTSGAWVADGAPDTTWRQAAGFANTGKNQRGDFWTRVLLPNILKTIDSDGSTNNVTFTGISTYAATTAENYEKADVIAVNSTGGIGQYLVSSKA
jgi:hypothetical protein